MGDGPTNGGKAGCLSLVAAGLACLTAAFAFGDEVSQFVAPEAPPQTSQSIDYVRETNKNLVGTDDLIIDSTMISSPQGTYDAELIADEFFLPEEIVGGSVAFDTRCEPSEFRIFNNTTETVAFTLGRYRTDDISTVALGPSERWVSHQLGESPYIILDTSGRWGHAFVVEKCSDAM